MRGSTCLRKGLCIVIDTSLLQAVAQFVEDAGNIVEDIAKKGFDTQFKGVSDPVTTADLACDTFLRERLLALLPGSGWLSEETRDDLSRLDVEYVWIVDPIDGTREFVEGVPQYAVSVALSKRGEAILGVICNPARRELFTGLVGSGAWLNGNPIRASRTRGEQLTVLGSRSEIKRGEFARFEQTMRVEAVGSIAYKLALVGAGQADATFSLGPKNEWDIAAGVAIVKAAGGHVTDKAAKPFVFNQQNTLVNGIVAATAESYTDLLAQLHAE
ncbi:hypothetical protein Alches_14560 [Alicyclobacillus hesperidum subsp. aegles]|nr:hypothetical protein Alches_14560 [Alicyclobacillus hesperidum subsp. aegles]